jgi:hypothetical protein
VDHVSTPVGAFGLIVAEDAFGHYVVGWLEKPTNNRFLRAGLRPKFNPGRTAQNIDAVPEDAC